MIKEYEIKTTNVFRKQYKKIKNDPNFQKEEFENVINLLSTGQILPIKNRNHLLSPKSKRYMGMPSAK